jgi:hypothetical protein
VREQLIYEAAQRSGWDSYAGAIKAAQRRRRPYEDTRLMDLLLGRKPLTGDDWDRLARLSTELRPHWPDWLADALCKRPTDPDYDCLAGLFEQIILQPDVSRLVDCLRGRKPLTADDCDRLRRYFLIKLRRRFWPDWLAYALCYDDYKRPFDLDYDRLADLVKKIGRRRGGVYDELIHRTARLVDAILSDRKVSPRDRSLIVPYALAATSNETGGAAPMLLVRREESERKKLKWPMIPRIASEEVDKALIVEITDGFVIVGKKAGTSIGSARVDLLLDQVPIVGKEPGKPIDPEWVQDALDQVRDLLDRPEVRRRKTR